jgi:hypothetical protein
MNQDTTTPTVRKTKGKRLSQEDYDQIKLLLAAGLKPSLVAEVSLRSHGTVNRIQQSRDFDEYKTELSKINAIYHARANNRKSSPAELEVLKKIEDPNDVINEGLDKLYGVPEMSLEERKVIALERQATALERLADAWEAHPKRTGLFGK